MNDRRYFTVQWPADRHDLDRLAILAERSAATLAIRDVEAGRSTFHASSGDFLLSLTDRSEEK